MAEKGGGDGAGLRYASYKWTTFASMYAGYTLLMLNRKSFSFALPAVMAEAVLHKEDLGLIASSQNLAYSLSKFLGGVLSDTLDPKLLFSAGLLLTGVLTIAFTGFETASAFALVWFLQGFVQGGVWPACAKILKQWAAPGELGSLWSVLSTSMNVAASAGPLLLTLLLLHTTWRAALVLIGSLAIGCTCVCAATLTRNPQEVGLASQAQAQEEAGRASSGRGRGSWRDMLRSGLLWVLCGGYCVVSMARMAALDWAQLYLITECGQSTYMGSMFITCMELGGIAGSLFAGVAADRAVARSRREDTRGTPRMTVVMALMALSLVSLHLLLVTVGAGSNQVYIGLLGALLGAGLYGPMALFGVMAVEAAPTHLAGTSHAIVALAANVGAVLAGLPFSHVAEAWQWRGAFLCLEAVLAAALVLTIVTRHLPYKLVLVRKKLE